MLSTAHTSISMAALHRIAPVSGLAVTRRTVDNTTRPVPASVSPCRHAHRHLPAHTFSRTLLQAVPPSGPSPLNQNREDQPREPHTSLSYIADMPVVPLPVTNLVPPAANTNSNSTKPAALAASQEGAFGVVNTLPRTVVQPSSVGLSSNSGDQPKLKGGSNSGEANRSANSTASWVSAQTPNKAEEADTPAFELACPICQQTRFKLERQPTRWQGLQCSRCARTFNASQRYVDLTLTSGVKQEAYNQKAWVGTELFRSPVISFVYERGWRQGFAWAGFPGVDREYEMAMRHLEPIARGQVLVDMSCGSGLFSRKFAASGVFSGVVAADFSESMLEQAGAFFAEKGSLRADSTPLLLLRADVARLPFPTGSVAAIHAGAALHCWPNPQAALAEISRVLKPGGVFVASTFLTPTAPLGSLVGNDQAVRFLNQVDPMKTTSYKWWEEGELRDLCTSVGLQDFSRERNWRFIMIAAKKPSSSDHEGWEGERQEESQKAASNMGWERNVAAKAGYARV